MVYFIIGISVVSLAAGVLLGVFFAARKPRRRRDHFTQAAEAEVYGDVTHLPNSRSGAN
jgi:hypothetical protein